MCQWGTFEDVKLFRPRLVSGRLVVPVDQCIAPLVQLLNDNGVRTVGSCCGHGKAPGFVSFEDAEGIVREITLQVAPEKTFPPVFCANCTKVFHPDETRYQTAGMEWCETCHGEYQAMKKKEDV